MRPRWGIILHTTKTYSTYILYDIYDIHTHNTECVYGRLLVITKSILKLKFQKKCSMTSKIILFSEM